jgi:hypothetical protein
LNTSQVPAENTASQLSRSWACTLASTPSVCFHITAIVSDIFFGESLLVDSIARLSGLSGPKPASA